MQAQLDGLDIKVAYGLVYTNNVSTFLALPKRKDSVSNDWPDEMGIDIDLSNPTFEAREFTLTCALIATSRDDFFNKYDALFTALSGMDTHDLYISDMDRTFKVYYKSQSNCTKLTRINADKVGVKFDLVFGETNPADNIPAVYLVDDQDRFLTA